MGCIACVPEDELYLIERFGKYHRTADSGFTCVGIPCVHTVRGRVSKRIDQIIVDAETKTKDNVFVNVSVATQYKVIQEKAVESFYVLESALDQLKTYVYDVIRSTVPKMLLDEVFVSKKDIADATRSQLENEMSEYGFAIVDTLVVDITPTRRVQQSMNSINEQKRLRKAAEEKAEAEKIVVVRAAEAEAEYQYLQGHGIARQRHVIIKGVHDSVSDFTSNTDIGPKEVTDLVIVNQYFDTIKELAKRDKSQVIFVTDDPNVENHQEKMLQALLAANH